METLKNITFEQLKNNFYKERTRKKFKKKYGDLFEHELPDISRQITIYQEPFKNRKKLIMEGDLVPGALIMANELLFWDDNDYDCPAVFIYSHDKYYEENPEELISLAHKLYDLTSLSEDELVFDMAKKEIADILKDEYSPSFNRVVPRELTGGRTVFMTTLVVVRDEIENGFLDRRIYPLLVKDGVISALILNYKFYDDILKSKDKITIKDVLILMLAMLGIFIYCKAERAVNYFVGERLWELIEMCFTWIKDLINSYI